MATIDVGLAYRDDSVSEWTEMAHSSEQRKLNCKFTIPKVWKLRHFVFLNTANCNKTFPPVWNEL